MRMSEVERFWAKVDLDGPGGCWLWTGDLSRPEPGKGYGRFRLASVGGVRGRQVVAHAYAWLLAGREIPDGYVLDHLCRVRRYVRPDHCEPTTQQVNILRGEGLAARHAAQTHCRRGQHPLSGDNLRIETTGSRRCRACARDAGRRVAQRRAASR